ncbi:protein GAST1-like [Asparagus officinalis]|uniref:protein GAST1-like n=1 Tax=Asparagus officinalis TaxID=4686 RepID=UPI00098DEB5B|nr:protein GAST1-like [Asparagus officinalis]
MASKYGIILFSLLFILIISQGSQAKHSHGPTPQPVETPTPSSQPNLPTYGVTQGSLQPQECPGRCTQRCSATQYRKPCMFFCKKCCETCLCVPPGTYGNKQSCPCYNNWKTKRGGPKCP